ncbi:MAG: TIGR01458 family HAD-type hydrolase [Thermogemmatispora sp.]|uniref:TIGR01458 family HAD-type hydrolase n=1 Tax=Thermogemmatispora sp. TaxID=1968838 RepID=UPI00263525DF|nr:TIGR01458 family HAD-type hydrolase [Thermogemmatispora sp.]MBX5458703.1 TIGR01458 family HAD-type hydrolase [Thermogemmatispora sp.]
MGTVRGVLLDIDGVLHVSMRPVEGAAEALRWLEQHGYRYAFVTNTTTMARSTLAQRLQEIGLPVSAERLITAPMATAAYLRRLYPGKRCWLLSKGDTAADFAGIELVDPLRPDDAEREHVAVVVIGGAEELLSYENMNRAFRLLMAGADLVAMHKNLYWRVSDGLRLDSGPFVSALELASGKQAVVVGKPERAFFEEAVHLLGTAPEETLMVGDDLVNDVQGARRAGLRALLVCTGKHGPDTPLLKECRPEERPEVLLPSVAALPDYLAGQG